MLFVERSPSGTVCDLPALQEDGMLGQIYVLRDVRPLVARRSLMPFVEDQA
jgi:hypothetical protein